MPDGSEITNVTVLNSIHDVSPCEWDACAGSGNPFVSHAFLAALEDSGSVSPNNGWLPRHLAIIGENEKIWGCVPLYLKSHSYGEYVFDWGWADAFEQAGGRYYPKLQAAIPFTPVTGPRLLIRVNAPDTTLELLGNALVALAEKLSVSSVHVTFAPEDTCRRLASQGFLVREGFQYHWHNRGYACFENFLADLSSRKRKAIRKERAGITEQNIKIRTLSGAEIEERHWDAFYQFYLDTIDRKWAHAYLKRTFFSELSTRLGKNVMLILAEDAAGEPVAGALNFIGDDAVYGRYWGCREQYKFLHFETCYYRAIDFAIEHNLRRVEAGAQGEHKIQRGYVPERSWSAHWIAHLGLREAVGHFVTAERHSISETIEALRKSSPFRKA